MAASRASTRSAFAPLETSVAGPSIHEATSVSSTLSGVGSEVGQGGMPSSVGERTFGATKVTKKYRE